MTANDSDITIQELQDTVHAWIEQWEEGYFGPLSNLARLTEEVGELAREINHQYGEKKKKDTEDPSAIADEIGDVLFVLVTLANSLDISLAHAIQQVLTKYDMRDAGRYTRKHP